MPFAMAIARGLEELHSRNIIACDLKPDNILCTDTGHAVIADFGISYVVSTTVGCVRPTNAQGTDNYMAPEQMFGGEEGGEVCFKSDVWAFACSVIHMLTGRRPLQECNKMQIMRKVGDGSWFSACWVSSIRKFFDRCTLARAFSSSSSGSVYTNVMSGGCCLDVCHCNASLDKTCHRFPWEDDNIPAVKSGSCTSLTVI